MTRFTYVWIDGFPYPVLATPRASTTPIPAAVRTSAAAAQASSLRPGPASPLRRDLDPHDVAGT